MTSTLAYFRASLEPTRVEPLMGLLTKGEGREDLLKGMAKYSWPPSTN